MTQFEGKRDILWTQVPKNGEDTRVSDIVADGVGKLISPDRDDIYNPPYTSELIIKGRHPYSGGQGSEKFAITGLMPLTDYFIYFVLRGTSQELSPVYCYKFTTTDIAKPKITLDDAGGGLFGIHTQVPANMNYALFTITELMNVAWFDSNHKLSTYSDAQTSVVNLNDKNKYTNYTGTDLTKPVDPSKPDVLPNVSIHDTDVRYDQMTLLQAMLATFDSNRVVCSSDVKEELKRYDGYSVFDVYANDATKRAVANVIRNTSSGQALFRNNKTTSANNRIEVNDTAQLKDQNGKTLHDYFYCFSVGYHTSSEQGTGDSFKALANLIIPDNDPPVLSQVLLSLDNQGASDTTYNGTLTLVFDKNLYWSDGTPGAGVIPVVNKANVDNTKYLLDDVGGSANNGRKLSPLRAGETPTSTFTIRLRGIVPSDSLVLFEGGRIANSTGPSTPDKLTITFKRDRTGSANDSGMALAQAYIEYTWRGRTYQSDPIPLYATP